MTGVTKQETPCPRLAAALRTDRSCVRATLPACSGAEVETQVVPPIAAERQRAGEAETVDLPQRRKWLRSAKELARRGYPRGGQPLRRTLSPLSLAGEKAGRRRHPSSRSQAAPCGANRAARAEPLPYGIVPGSGYTRGDRRPRRSKIDFTPMARRGRRAPQENRGAGRVTAGGHTGPPLQGNRGRGASPQENRKADAKQVPLISLLRRQLPPGGEA